jgi:hypothetical protein
MRPLHCLKQLAITLACVLGWYLLLRLPIALFHPVAPASPIDTCVANTTLAGTAPSIALYEVDRLARPAARRMVIVGSSNAMLSLRPKDLRETLPRWEILNLAIPTSNVHQALQVVTLAASVSDDETLKHTVFVLGIYPGLFAESKSLWRRDSSPLTREMLRYGLYRSGSRANEPVPVFGYALAWLTKDLYRTVLAAEAFATGFRLNVTRLGTGKSVSPRLLLGIRERPCRFRKRPAGTASRKRHIERRIQQIGTTSTLKDEQFEELERLVRTVRESGARLIITELPVPEWNRLDHFNFYRKRKQAFVRKLVQGAGGSYLDLHDSVPDDLMGDATHPLREGARTYASAFASKVRALGATR